MIRPTIPESSWLRWHDDEPIRLGVSSCLLGASVRYDGGHKRDSYLVEVLGEWFEWVSVCPEIEIGLGVPRPTIQLQSSNSEPQLVEPISGEVLTKRMEDYAARRLAEIEELGLDGFIFKSRSPSCGLHGVEVVDEDRSGSKTGVGIFARVLVERWPGLPVAEEGMLGDPGSRGDFVERVLGHYRQRVASDYGLDAKRLAELDAAHRALREWLRAKG